MLSNIVIYTIEAVIFGGFMVGVMLISTMIFQNIKRTSKLKSFDKINTNRIKKFKEEGGIHSWVNMTVRMPNGKIEETHVCKHTGYVPAIEGFVELEQVRDVIRQRKVAKEFDEYKREKLLDWGEEYLVDDMKGLYAKIIGLKQAFHVEKIEKELKNGKS